MSLREHLRIHHPEHGEARWPASLAVGAAVVLYVTLPDTLIPGPRWLPALVVAALLVPLTLIAPRRHQAEAPVMRVASVALIALVNVANIATLVLLVHFLLGGNQPNGRQLVLAAVEIWLTNVIVFGLWYWELDRGGPSRRLAGEASPPAFLFPQMSVKVAGYEHWQPSFVDYLYVSLTNATAFSPTDTMPLSRWVKTLMGAQAVVSLITVALVAARAVNILT